MQSEPQSPSPLFSPPEGRGHDCAGVCDQIPSPLGGLGGEGRVRGASQITPKPIRSTETLAPLSLFFSACAILVATRTFAAEPIAVGDRTCLFFDERFIAEQSGLKRTWHQGQPRPEVAIKAEKENVWEKWPHLFGSVIHDPKDGLYRMYYEVAIYPHREGRTSSFTCHIWYAESKDGKTWTKRKLGLFEDLGSKENNIVIPDAELAVVLVDPLEPDPGKRLKMFVYLQRKFPWPDGEGQSESLLSSGDGLHWKYEGGFNKPSYANPTYGGYTDCQTFSWDPLTQQYMAYIHTFDPHPPSGLAELKTGCRRAIGVSRSCAINKGWAPIEHVLAADEQDDAAVAKMSKDPNTPDWAELYSMPYFNYGNHYIGLLSILYLIDKMDSNGGGDLQLTFSHDAKTWYRVYGFGRPERESLIAPSNAAPELFPTYIQVSEPLDLGDEMWMYYTEANGAHPLNPIEKSV